MDGKTTFDGAGWKGEIADGKGGATPPLLTGTREDGAEFRLTRVVRKSPVEGAKPPDGALVLFDGTNVNDWKNGKIVEDNLLGQGATTKRTFRDFRLHVEFRLPFKPKARGQERGNSGVYLQRRYEIQVLDSFGLAGDKSECGAVYEQTPPAVNMCYPPLSWQTYDIDFKAARYDADGKKTADAVVSVIHNGVKVHDKQDVPTKTGYGDKEADTPGPINLQDHGNPVYFRNVWVVTTD